MWTLVQKATPTRWRAGLACVAVLLAAGSRASADNIDNELRVKALPIMRDLESHGYKNVGILKFQVKRGINPPTLTAGKLNYLMATRLENALVMVDRPGSLIGLTRGASAVAAAKDNTATYLTREGRQKLFDAKYPLAWGTENVDVDAFLTGLVEIAPDAQKTKIIIRAFDKKNPDFRDLLTFTVDTDLAILRDTNQNFVVARRSFNSWAAADDPDDELVKIAVKDAAKETSKATEPNARINLAVEEMKDYLDFRVLYDGKPVRITPDGFVNEPKPGQSVVFKVTAKEKVGLLLRVNGVNTLNRQSDEKPDLHEYSWWVLDPGVEYTIKGFYSDGKVKAFETRANADVDAAAELGEKAERHGKIELDIFVDPSSIAKETTPRATKPNNTFRTVNTRAATFEELKSQVFQGMPAKRTIAQRSFIVGGATGDQTLQLTKFDGRHVGGITINYQKGPPR